MKILIENYRGFEISFDTNKEEFYCVSSDFDTQKTKVSYSAAKKYIDDFIKENNVFKPFVVHANPNEHYYYQKPIKIVGIRKDGAFVGEDNDGKKEQISKHYETLWILPKQENEPILAEINKVRAEIEALRENEKQLRKTLTIVTLKDIKSQYTPAP